MGFVGFYIDISVLFKLGRGKPGRVLPALQSSMTIKSSTHPISFLSSFVGYSGSNTGSWAGHPEYKPQRVCTVPVPRLKLAAPHHTLVSQRVHPPRAQGDKRRSHWRTAAIVLHIKSQTPKHVKCTYTLLPYPVGSPKHDLIVVIGWAQSGLSCIASVYKHAVHYSWMTDCFPNQ